MDELKSTSAVIITEVIKNLAKDMASFIASKIKDYCIDTSSKEQVDSGWAFEDYLQNVRRTYSKCTTYLYKYAAKDLKLLFEPLDLFFQNSEVYSFNLWHTKMDDPHRNKRISSRDIAFLLIDNPRLLITGNIGTGKTLLLKYFCTSAINEGFRIPVFISLRWFNSMDVVNDPLEKLIYERLNVHGFKLNYDYFLYSLEGNKYLFLFDGFDEISTEKRPTIAQKISDFTEKYHDNYFVMTSRPLEITFCWEEYSRFGICNMTLTQAEDLIYRLEFDYISKKRFIDDLEGGFFDKYNSLISSPLTLSIMFDTYIHTKTTSNTISVFNETFFKTALYTKDSRKEGLERRFSSGLKRSQIRTLFQHFCFKTYFNNEQTFTDISLEKRISESCLKLGIDTDVHAYKDDIVNVIGMLVKNEYIYTFIHPSTQAYFAAYYISSSPKEDDKKAELFSAIIKKLNLRNLNGLSFFNMFFDLEQDRFESIILLPIYNKIWESYLSFKKDYYKTVINYLSYSIEGQVTIDEENLDDVAIDWHNDASRRVAIRENASISTGINDGEALLLIYYGKRSKYYNAMTKSTDFKSYINNCFASIYQDLESDFGIEKSFLISEVGKTIIYGGNDYHSACKDLITFFYFALKRKELLLPMHDKDISIIIEKF